MATPSYARQALILISCAICPARVDSKGAFLEIDPNAARSDLLRELESAIGRDQRFATERRVSRLEDAMRPTFNALPKDESGRLDGNGVRYMLRRLFGERHGWFVDGLETNVDGLNSSSPTDMIGTVAGSDAQGVFDKHLNTHGFDLHHAAVLAATFENLVHIESVERLQMAYDLVGVSSEDSNASDEVVDSVISTYMLMYVLHKNHSNTTREWVYGWSIYIQQMYSTWDDTVNFVHEIRKSVLEGDREEANAALPNSWNTTLKVLEKFGERYGWWQDRECRDMKRKLLEMEDGSTGRVPLRRFYEHAFTDPAWQFKESLETLKLMGIVDDSDPSSMSVIIPNYINGPNNCAAGGKFYHVCCINECNALMSHLEQHLGAFEATPEQIADLVAALPSDTMAAPRTLPHVLVRRLQDIANHHGGRVPLHGRLFAQWMHHAYPRECSYPHVSGTTTAVTSSQIMARADGITLEDHASIVNDADKESRKVETGDERDLPWTSEEELFVCKPGLTDNEEKSLSRSVMKTCLMIAFSLALVFVRLQSMSKGGSKAASKDYWKHEHYV